MMEPNTLGIVDAALIGDAEAFKNSFDAALTTKIGDALDVRKIEIASTLVTPEESINEPEEIIDGIDADAVSDEDTSDAEFAGSEDTTDAE
jgi:hypothetical protein